MTATVSERASQVRVGDKLVLANDRSFTLIAGLNVLESEALALEVADALATACAARGVPWIFKASFDKANRSSHTSFRGPGLERGLSWLAAVKSRLEVPILTDIHTADQAPIAAEVADVLQIPAFLVRQTDLIAAAARTARPLHLKKMQGMSPDAMGQAVAKAQALGAHGVIACERGTSFGYENLVVDPLSFGTLKALGVPVTFDVTHALQLPGALGTATGGRGHRVFELAVAGMSQGLAGLFLECHPSPAKARCDGPCALPLGAIGALLDRLVELDALVKSWRPVPLIPPSLEVS